MTKNTNNTLGVTIGVLLGGILWWNDVVGLWGAFAIMIIIPLLVGMPCPKKVNDITPL